MALGLGGFDGSALRVAADTLGIGGSGKSSGGAGTSFEISEIGGSTVVLKDRACPFPECSWPTEQKTKKTNYPGNPDASIQVLGYDLPDLEIEGEWNYRFLPKTIVVDGSPDFVQTPAEACRLFDKMARSGRMVRVQWLNIVRVGVLKKFTPTPMRETDFKWAMAFEWAKADDANPERPNLPSKGFGLSDIMKALNFVEDVLALAPDLAASLNATLVSGVRSLQAEVSLLVQSVRAVESLLYLPSAVFGAIESAVASIRDQCTELARRLSGPRMSARGEATAATASALSSDPALPSGSPQSPASQQATFEGWSRTSAKALLNLRAQVLGVSEELALRVRPGVAKRITVRAGETLGSIAAREYGSDSYATYLAHVNRLQSALVSPGTELRIPERPYGGAEYVEPTGTEEQIITLTGA